MRVEGEPQVKMEIQGSGRPPDDSCVERPHSLAASQSLAAFRARTVLSGAKLCALLNIGCVLAGIVKCLVSGHQSELPALLLDCVPIYLPSAAVAAGWDASIVPVCTLSHVLTSLLLFCKAYHFVPLYEVVEYVLANRYEVVTVVLVSLQYQLSIPTMAVLNALRAVAWWLVSVRLMHKDPWQNALTRLGDFAMLMVLHCAYEARTRIMYKRACNKEQQQNALISPGLASQGTSCDSARAAPGPPQSAPQAMARLKSFETDLNGGSHFTAAANFSDGVFSASLSPRMEVDTSERSLLTTISSVNETVARIKVPYIRKPRNQEGQFHIKLVDIHMDDLSPDFATDFQRQLRPCMPGMHMCGAVVRPGCVLMTLDVIREEPDAEAAVTAEAAAANMLGEVAGAIRTSGGQMRDGALVYCQLPDGRIAVSTWDAASSEFRHADAGVLPASVLQLRQQGAMCSLQMLGPHLQCVPLTSGMQTTLPLQISAPCNSRLMGWQPRGAAVSAEDSALRLNAEGESTDSDAPDVSVLVRRVNGQYMPVTLRQTGTVESDGACATVGVEATVTLDTYGPCGLRVELWGKGVRDTVEGRSPPELLCASFPLVVLPSHWEAAATELQAHVATLGSVQTSTPLCDTTVSEPAQAAADATADPATDLLTDITLWLSLDVEGSGAGVQTARLSEDLGRTLVYYTVQWGMVEVSQLLMTTMAGRAGVAGSTVVGWFARLASQVPSREETGGHNSEGGGLSEWESDDTLVSLIHVACYSGSPDMLEKVLRWGLVYGGGVWRWPWLLEDKRGRTPLHLIAARPDPTVCIPMLKTLRRMLTLRELQAAYAVWSECTGGVNVTPMQCFVQAHPESVPAAQRVWADVANTQLPNASASPRTQDPSVSPRATVMLASQPGTKLTTQHSGISPARSLGLQSGALSQPAECDSAAAAGAAGAAAGSGLRKRVTFADEGDNTGVRGRRVVAAGTDWLQVVRDVCCWEHSVEYKTWANAQLSGAMLTWAWCLAIIYVMCIMRLMSLGTIRHELFQITFHAIPYFGIILSRLLPRGTLPGWQAMMPAIPVIHTITYLYIALRDNTPMLAWTTSARVGTDMTHAAILVAPNDQSPLPFAVASRIPLAITQGLAYHAAGASVPFLRSFTAQCVGILLCALVRTYQVRAYHRWRVAAAQAKQAVAQAAPSGAAGSASASKKAL